ncbi:MAG TPA: glutathione S-transferase C-terminal domain-containing protein [Azospirillum sp.]|nr:glutathione S-transferase C-terminal domain-containing protein [Azospirillum sp.]
MTRTVKMMIDGRWHGDVPDTAELRARRAAQAGRFRNRVAADGASGFAAEAGRYHLYVSYACPWAHRTILYRRLKGLEDVVGMSVLHPRWGGPEGWTFGDTELSTPDHAGGRRFLHEVYAAAAPNYTGKVTVPVLWDTRTGTIVNNQSGDIIRMLDEAFDGVGGDASLSFRPTGLRAAIDTLNAWLLPDLCEGVYAAGFAETQQAYEAATQRVFTAMDRLESLLGDGRPYLLGERVTEPDWHLFCTTVRFEIAYYGALRCNLKSLDAYPNLLAHRARLLAHPGVAETVRLDHVRRHYYDVLGELNREIVPLGPPSAALRVTLPEGLR